MSKSNSKHRTDVYDVLIGRAESKDKPCLTWDSKLGVGYFPPYENFAYAENYWDHYRKLEGTKMCHELNRFRVDLVEQFIGDLPLLDVGIGCGTFIKEREHKTYGGDVNPMGILWLKERGLYKTPFEHVDNASYWDVAEHIPDLAGEVDRVEDYIFMSMPIYDNEAHCLESKHFKPNEHLWYFTEEGLVDFMKYNGFDCEYRCCTESEIGREEVMTFVFLRS